MVLDGFLGRALMDPATGLPNLPYFLLIQDWEERRARRRHTKVCVLRLHVEGGDERVRQSLSWRLCQEVRTSDLIASNGRDEFRILLTSPDAENADAIRTRIEESADIINADHPDATPLVMHVDIEATTVPSDTDAPHQHSPCEPCDEHAIRAAMDKARVAGSPADLILSEKHS